MMLGSRPRKQALSIRAPSLLNVLLIYVWLSTPVWAFDKKAWIGSLVAKQQTNSLHPLLFKDIPMIPGTHNSACVAPRSAVTRLIWPWVQNQTLSLEAQLQLGVRFLDLRVTRKTSDSEIYCSHRFLTSVKLKEALRIVRTFLDAHPSEFVLVYIRADWDNQHTLQGEHWKGLTKLIEAEVGSILAPVKAKEAETRDPVFDVNTPVAELQGKIVLFHGSGDPFIVESPLSFGFPRSAELRELWNGDLADGVTTFHRFFQTDVSQSSTINGIVFDVFTLGTRRSVADKFNGLVKHMPNPPLNRSPGLVVVDFLDEPLAIALFRLFVQDDAVSAMQADLADIKILMQTKKTTEVVFAVFSAGVLVLVGGIYFFTIRSPKLMPITV